MTTILIKKKDTSGAPAPGDLTNSTGGAELAVNTADKRLYTKDGAAAIVEVGTNPSTLSVNGAYSFPTADGTASQVLATNGSGTLSFITAASGTVTQVATGTGLTGGPITGSGTVSVATNGITDTLLRQSAGLSVIGRSGNTTGNVADVTAATDNQVLRRSGTSIGFGAINLASTDAVTGDLPFSNLAQGSALSVLGVTGNATADNASIAAGSDHQVLRRSGTSVAFGAVALNQTNAITGTLPVANGGTGITSFGTGVATWLGTPSSANLAAAMTDETGSGLLVFGTTPTITGLREKSTAVSASDIDLSAGNYFTKTISGATTFTVSNVASSGDVAAFVLVLTDGGAYTVTYFSGVTFAGGTAPTLTASGVDILAFFTINGGTTWRGLVLALDIKAP
jgi:hypothetical protein